MAITQTQFNDMMDRNLNPFRQDVVGDDTINILADTPTKLLVNGNTRNDAKAPAYMTDRWNTTTSIMKATTEYDHPVYVGDIGFVWTPTVGSEGTFYVRVYINDATPKLIRTYEGSYKGDSAVPKNILATWYWGDDTGYDAKNDGVYFVLEFEHSGTVTAPSIVIYNTQ
jgi:hypothetical protein